MHEDCYHKMYLNEESHWWFKSKIDIVRALLRIGVTDIKNKKILDAGCGTSFLSKCISPNLANIYNVDNCELSLNYSKRRGMLNVISADLNQLPFNNEAFDVCVCMDVIEHNKDDKLLVGELGRVVKKGGVMVASVPALQSLWSPQDKKLGHYKRYNKGGFGELFEDNFDIIKLSYFNSLLFPPIFIFRKVFNAFPGLLKEKDELDINNKFLNRILYHIFSLESYLLRYVNLPFGVSLIIVARKK